MCALFRTNSKAAPLLNLSTLKLDLHAHVLPGIDDGPETHDQAIALLSELKNLGLRTFHATPHVMADLYPNAREDILRIYTTFIESPEFLNLGVTLHCAAEYFIDHSFLKLVQNDDLLPIAQKYLLVEMSTFSPSPILNEALFEVQTKGYIPILAHPERYIYYISTFEQYKELKDRGCLFQINILSLSGHYGKQIKRIAWKLLKENLVDFIATDTHHQNHIDRLSRFIRHSKGQELLTNYTFQNVNLI